MFANEQSSTYPGQQSRLLKAVDAALEHCKQQLTFATALLALTITFNTNLVPKNAVWSQQLLLLAWVALVVCIGVGLLTLGRIKSHVEDMSDSLRNLMEESWLRVLAGGQFGLLLVGVGVLLWAIAPHMIPSARGQITPPNLVGSWSGTGTSVRLGDPHPPATPEPIFHGPLTGTLTVERQEGTLVNGTWLEGGVTEKLLGAIRADGKTIQMVDKDGTFHVILLSPTQMEVCYTKTTGQSMATACYILTKR